VTARGIANTEWEVANTHMFSHLGQQLIFATFRDKHGLAFRAAYPVMTLAEIEAQPEIGPLILAMAWREFKRALECRYNGKHVELPPYVYRDLNPRSGEWKAMNPEAVERWYRNAYPDLYEAAAP